MDDDTLVSTPDHTLEQYSSHRQAVSTTPTAASAQSPNRRPSCMRTNETVSIERQESKTKDLVKSNQDMRLPLHKITSYEKGASSTRGVSMSTICLWHSTFDASVVVLAYVNNKMHWTPCLVLNPHFTECKYYCNHHTIKLLSIQDIWLGRCFDFERGVWNSVGVRD